MDSFPDLSSYKALIFDLDGTLINSMPLHVIAWTMVYKERGYTIDPQIIYDLGGMSSKDVVMYFNNHGLHINDVDAFVARKVEVYRSHFDKLHTFKPIEKILRDAKASGKLIGVGTGTQRINVDTILKLLNLTDCVDASVSASEVTRHKPFPDTFLKAAELLNVKPSECVVFEDGPLGIKSALDGGFDCIEVENGSFKRGILKPE